MSADPQRVEAILAETAAIADPAAHAAYLNEACACDVELRAEVESLLAAYEKAGSYLDRPAPGATLVVSPLGGLDAVPAEARTTSGEQPNKRS